MERLLKNWRIRMVNYRQEADNATSNITRLKAMNKFLTYRDCIKELEEAISVTHSSLQFGNKKIKGCASINIDLSKWRFRGKKL